MVSPDCPPDRWACPNCGGIIEEITYATLPRAAFQGTYGVFTSILCPICKQQTIGMAWRVVEVTGTEGIV